MQNIFEKFNNQVDLEGLKGDISTASQNTGDFEKIPHGKYEVSVDKMELKETKSEPVRPMLTIQFNVLDGDYKGKKIFYNQTLYSKTGEHGGMMVGFTKDMLNSLDSGIEVDFIDFVQYANLILDIFEAIEGKKEYALDFEDNKGFDKFAITEVFGVNDSN